MEGDWGLLDWINNDKHWPRKAAGGWAGGLAVNVHHQRLSISMATPAEWKRCVVVELWRGRAR